MTADRLPLTSADRVRSALRAGEEVALIDLRDETDFAEAHPLFAASLPLAQIATDIAIRVPRKTTPIVLYDGGDDLVAQAATALRALGYTDVSALDGGLHGWRASGGEIFRDVNTPSKAFGELVESRCHTPFVSALELRAMLDARADLIVVDARRFDEYQTMNIPTSVSMPGAELVYRVRQIAPRPETMIVVNCAGRTRSIIGAQSLINAGVPNRVAALRNGTIGWTLEGLALEHGQSRRFAPVTGDRAVEARIAARGVANKAGVRLVDRRQVETWAGDRRRTLYRFDVRTPEEFAAGHLPDFRSAPGGQLVQETDVFAPVRGARIVVCDDVGVRADMTASWLAQMGWDVAVLPLDPTDPARASGHGDAPPAVRTGRRYKRPYEGTDNPRVAMQAYLEWEYGLVAQLERDGTHGFTVLA